MASGEKELTLLDKIKHFASGSLKGATTDLVGAPVDIANEVLRPFGLASETPVGGSKFLREKLTGSKAEGKDKSIYETIGTFVNPEVAAKAMIVAAARMPERLKEFNKIVSPTETKAERFDRSGVYRDKDGGVKTIISDQGAFADRDMISAIRSNTHSTDTVLADVLVHPELYKTYPELANVPVKTKVEKGIAGAMEPNNSALYLNPAVLGTDPKNWTSTLLHEVQHAVQHTPDANFGKGGSVGQFLDFDPVSVQVKIDNARKSGDVAQMQAADRYAKKLNEKLQEARNRYLNLPGEQEARYTQETMNMSEAELAADVKALLLRGDTPQTYDTRPIRPLPSKP